MTTPPDDTKVNCSKCGKKILQATATRTGGLCMPCKRGAPARPDPNAPVEISCGVPSEATPDPVIFAAAQDLLQELEKIGHVGDATHANKFEVEAQKALLRHAVRYRANFRLNDDHWGRTRWALLSLFEQGKATMQVDGNSLRFADVAKKDWGGSSEPLAGFGGFLYRDSDGRVIYKIPTSRS